MTMQPEPEQKSGAGAFLKNLGVALLRVLQALVLALAMLLKGLSWVLGKVAGAGRKKKEPDES